MSKRNANSSLDEPIQKTAKMEQDGRLQLYSSLYSLQSMCNIRIAVTLWYHRNVRHLTKEIGYSYDDAPDDESVDEEEDDDDESYYGRGNRYWDDDYECKTCSRKVDFSVSSLKERVESSLNELTLPPSLVPGIKKFIPSIGSAIDTWVSYQHQRIFFDLSKDMVYKHVDEIIWYPNGTINYAESGKNMLSSLKINQVEKYRIICTYCLEEELKNLPLSLFCSKYFENVIFENHPLIYYWNCVAKDELEKILVDGDSSLGSRMITLNRVDNTSAIVYFFEQLTDEDKVEKAKLLIRRFGRRYQQILMNRLTEMQQQHLFLEMGVDIVLNFANLSSSSKHALSCWIFMRNLITKEQYVDMVSRLLNLALGDRYGRSALPQPHAYTLFTSIWKTSSGHFKQYALKCRDRFLITKIIESTFSERNMKLLQDMLSGASNHLKKEIIWSDSGRKLLENQIKSSRPSVLNCFLKLCLPDANEALKFRSELLKSEFFADHCLNLCIERKFVELNTLITTCSQSPSTKNEYLARLLNTEKAIAKFVQMIRLLDIVSFKNTVNQLLPDGNTAANFIRKVALSRNAIQIFFAMVQKGEFNKVNDYVSQLLPNDVKTVKHALLSFIQGKEITKMFVTCDENKCREFLLWCLNSEENVTNFKKSLPFEDIFLSMFKQSIFTVYDSRSLSYCKFCQLTSFVKLDRFLNWFFVNSEQVKRFKIAKIYNFKQIQPICTLSRKKDKSYLKNVANWFFGGDVQQIRRFKMKYPMSQISDLF